MLRSGSISARSPARSAIVLACAGFDESGLSCWNSWCELSKMVQKMSESMKFIHFGNDWFADNRTSSHHIAKRIGTRFPMLYVEVPGLKKPKASMRDLRKILEKIRLTFQ